MKNSSYCMKALQNRIIRVQYDVNTGFCKALGILIKICYQGFW